MEGEERTPYFIAGIIFCGVESAMKPKVEIKIPVDEETYVCVNSFGFDTFAIVKSIKHNTKQYIDKSYLYQLVFEKAPFLQEYSAGIPLSSHEECEKCIFDSIIRGKKRKVQNFIH